MEAGKAIDKHNHCMAPDCGCETMTALEHASGAIVGSRFIRLLEDEKSLEAAVGKLLETFSP